MRVVIVGNGPASASAIESFREIDKDSEIIVLSDEEFPTYAPNCMENVIRNDIQDSALFYKGGFEFYERYKVDFRPKKEVKAVDTKRRVVIASDGDEIEYDKCLLAAGADSFIPPIQGIELGGVTTAKNLYDAFKIKEWIKGGKIRDIVIVGAGPIGIEDAETLNHLGFNVTVVEIFNRVLPRMLDKDMADIYMKYLEDIGIRFLLEHQVTSIEGSKWVEGVRVKSLQSDKDFFVKADMVILSVGVRPRTRLVENTDIKIHTDEKTGKPMGGILTDEYQRTSNPDVYAAGDICSSVDVFGKHRWIALFPAAQQEGYIAGYNMAGLRVKNEGSVDYNAVKTREVTAGSGGIFGEDKDILKVEYDNYLIKIFLSEGRITGYQFVGIPVSEDINKANPLLSYLIREDWKNTVISRKGIGLESSGVLMHNFIRNNRIVNETHIDIIMQGILRALGSTALDTPLFRRTL